MLYSIIRDVAFLVSRVESMRKISAAMRLGAVVVGTFEVCKKYDVMSRIRRRKSAPNSESK